MKVLVINSIETPSGVVTLFSDNELWVVLQDSLIVKRVVNASIDDFNQEVQQRMLDI